MSETMNNPLLTAAPQNPPPASANSTLSGLPEPEIMTAESKAKRCGCVTLVIIVICIVLAAVAILIALLLIVGGQPPRVRTECGLVEGKYDMQKDVFVFKGIPYAVPPVGPLRWQPPVPMQHHNGTCWEGTLQAVREKSDCAQKNYDGAFTGKEDCLYLDIITPKTDLDAELPVIVFIHGGYLRFGTAHMDGYSPNEDITKEINAVFVSIQYRLGAFGFLTLEVLQNHTGNYGLLDQMEALRWVRDNIHGFGGDPNKVTVMGHSSGGSTILAMLTSPSTTNLFQRAWIIGASPYMNHTKEEAEKSNEFFLNRTNCHRNDCLSDACIRDCLYKLPAQDVAAGVYPEWGYSEACDLPTKDSFELPLLVIDGNIIPQSPLDALLNNATLDVPLLIGTTAQECDNDPVPKDIQGWTEQDYQNYVRQHLNPFGNNITNGILARYEFEEGELTYTTLTTDIRVTCGTQILVDAAVRGGRNAPVYQYVVTSYPSSPVNAFHVEWAAKYAFHGWDVFAFFRKMSVFMTGNPTQKDWDFSNVLRDNVRRFAASGEMAARDWGPMPNQTALLSDEVNVVFDYNKRQCDYINDSGFYVYSWWN